ncbi:uncharacterized protein AB675_11876 [Cyphellophora attinorum]|uniref:DUF2293 domain-containing protein n=1 Tax=Cyphellophora attinorum TaxID=1664694 RepID=A0A0N1NWM5_9EURO|nr:uncharacterized protein AB675_11876 [Phialophora attinorum]KPI36802.1 hypothetical protein AB675_11876 [Phialophora attinorum]
MARVTSQKNARHNGAYGNNRGSQIAKQHHKNNQKQKVVVESGKGQDRNVLSFHTEPPQGYTFIPAGNPQLTAALKEFAKRGNHKIFSVSTTPHASRHELSREVHRVGYHFPTFVVAQVCNHYGIRLTRTGHVIDEKQNDNFMKVYQKGQLVLDAEIPKDQITVNTEAKETIKDLFPNIPDNDLFQIIKTAFQLGDGKVGTAEDVPLTRRASLSVVAHIRHVYTRYDKLLRRMPYNNARHEVEAETLTKLVEWRGDGSAESGAINDVLDDVIVISDEEKSDAEPEDGHSIHQNEVRVEELDHSTYWPAATRPLSPLRVADEPTQGYRFLPHASYRYQPEEIAVRERNRAARWEQARQDYRSTLSQAGPSYQRVMVREPSPARHLIPLDPPQGRVLEREYLGPSRSGPVEVISRPESPRYSAPQTRYERIDDAVPQVRYEPIDDGYQPPHPVYHPDSRPLTPIIVKARRRSASPDGDRTIVQSIEGPNGAYSPSMIRHNENARSQNHQISANQQYRDRKDYQSGRSSPIDARSRNPFGQTQHSRTASGQYIQDQPMQRTGSRREIVDIQSAPQRIMVTDSETVYSSDRDHTYTRSNPFQDRPLEPVTIRREPLPAHHYDNIRTVHTATPPRRILEPIGDPYSDSGPQRYREYDVPVTTAYYGSAPSTAQYLAEPPRRVVYANPPEEYVTTTRYEPLR